MTQQYTSLVEAEYTTPLTTADSGDALDPVILRDSLTQLANRIEYLKTLQNEATEEPERFFTIEDDFTCAIYDNSNSVVYSDRVWRTFDTGSPTVTSTANTAGRPGLFRVTCATSDEFFMGINDTAGSPFGMITTQHVTFVVRIQDDPGNLATSFTMGLKQDYSLNNGGSNSLLLFYSVAAANWQLIVRKAGVQVTHNLGVAVDSTKFVTCRFVKNVNDIDVYLDGALVHTVLSAAKPSGELNFGYSVLSSAADAQPIRLFFDYVFARTRSAGIVGSPRSGV